MVPWGGSENGTDGYNLVERWTSPEKGGLVREELIL